MGAKKRIYTGLMILGFIALALLAAIVTVFALPQHNFGGDFYIYFNRLTDVTAQVQASFTVLNGTETEMLTSAGSDTLSFTPNTSEGLFNEFHNNNSITLTPQNNSVVLKYKFSNTGSDRFVSELVKVPTSVGGTPVTAAFSRDGVNYDKVNTGLSLNGGETGYYYVKLEAANLTQTASLSGDLNWDMQKISNTAVARIGSTTYETFKAAYNAATENDIIAVLADGLTLTSSIDTKNISIIADTGVSVVNGLTINAAQTIQLSANETKIGINNGSKINIKCLNTSATEIFNVSSSGNLFLTSVKLIPNGTNQRGIYTSAKLEMDDCDVSGFTSAGNGGAVFLADNAYNCVLKNSTFNNNSASEKGGAIYTAYWTNLTLENCEIVGNSFLGTAEWAGGAAILSDGPIILSNCKINNNTGASDGGGVYAVNTLTITGGEIKENIANNNGGGVCSHGETTITGTTISHNIAQHENGGGIRIVNRAASFDNCILSGNQAGLGGGGIYSNNTLTITGSEIKENIANNNGGGVYSQDETTITGTTISHNIAQHENGGGIRIVNRAASFDNCILSGNQAGLGGGGIYSNNTLTITGSIISENELTDDQLNSYGSGIYATALTMEDCEVTLNKGAGLGAGIYVTDTSSITSSTISQNESIVKGAGIYSGGTLTITGTTISENKLTHATEYKAGAGLHVYQMEMDDCDVTLNTGANDGGGLMITGNSKILNSTISQHVASGLGGGMYASVGIEVVGSDVLNNSAGTKGAGIYAHQSLTVNNSEISNNTITSTTEYTCGAGIQATYLTMDNCTVSNNTGAQDGGGLLIVGGSTTITDSTISNNTADNGGGICAIAGGAEVNLENSTLSNNTANYSGGGIYVANTVLIIEDTMITENICNPSTHSVSIGLISQNIYQSMGGGIMVGDGAIVGFASGEICKNKVVSTYNGKNVVAYGGNVFVNAGGMFMMGEDDAFRANGKFLVTSPIISGAGKVEAGYEVSLGDGVYVQTGGDFVMVNGEIKNCRAVVGAAIANTGNVLIMGGKITGNLATNTTTSLNFTNSDGISVPVSSGIINAGNLVLADLASYEDVEEIFGDAYGADYCSFELDADICMAYQNITSSSEPTYGSICLGSELINTTPYKLTFADISIGLGDIGSFLNGTYKPQPATGSNIIGKYDSSDSPIIKLYDTSFVWGYEGFGGFLEELLVHIPTSVDLSKFVLANNTQYTLTLTSNPVGSYLKKNS